MNYIYRIIKLTLLAVILICAFLFLVFGIQNMTTRKFDYNKPTVDYSWGSVVGRFVGDWHETENGDQIFGSPYEICLGIYTTKISDGVVTITNIDIYATDSGESFHLQDELLKEQITRDSEGRNAVYYCTDIKELAYNRYKITFDLLIESSDTVIREGVTLSFNKEYDEYKSNRFMDRLMGI